MQVLSTKPIDMPSSISVSIRPRYLRCPAFLVTSHVTLGLPSRSPPIQLLIFRRDAWRRRWVTTPFKLDDPSLKVLQRYGWDLLEVVGSKMVVSPNCDPFFGVENNKQKGNSPECSKRWPLFVDLSIFQVDINWRTMERDKRFWPPTTSFQNSNFPLVSLVYSSSKQLLYLAPQQ